uniref:Ragulator complex protein LAMTOR5 n=1 Tax=Petromyzon marinus TaxID=7757 RepID=S4RBA3_PETMA
MESVLEKHLDDTMKSPGVMGVLCTDSHGLNLGSRRGLCNDKEKHAGVVSVLAAQATQLSPDPMDVPVVCLESDNGNILIMKHSDITVAMHKVSS